MGTAFGIVLVVVSLFITAKICEFINRNTVGTTWAYIRRFVVVFIIVFAIVFIVLGGAITNLIS